MQRTAVCQLGDLFAATEAVGEDEAIFWRVADGGEEFEFADGLRDFVFVVEEAEGAGHAAAAGGGRVEVDAEAAQEGFFGGHLHQGFVMAVAVDEGLSVQAGELHVVTFQELAEQECLLRKRAGAFVAGEEVAEFVAEDGYATWLETDDRDSGGDFGFEGVQDFLQQGFRAIEESEVVEGTATAESGAGDLDAEAGVFEDFDGCLGDFGREIVGESVGPEEDAAALRG